MSNRSTSRVADNGEGPMRGNLELLKRVKTDIETVLFNPTGVNPQELTELRDKIVGEISAIESPQGAEMEARA